MQWSHFTPDLVLKHVPQTEQTCELVGSVLRDGSAESSGTDGRNSVHSIESDEPWKPVSSLVAGLSNPTHELGADWLVTSPRWRVLAWTFCCEDGVNGGNFGESKSSEGHTSDDD
jgi:hypothetical protein